MKETFHLYGFHLNGFHLNGFDFNSKHLTLNRLFFSFS
jgi:hypothetical protein